MNIENDKTYRLARELAAATGESLTDAVTVAVRERLLRVRGRQGGGLAERLLRIGRECAPHLSGPNHPDGPAGSLYDERGLPR